MSTLIRKLISTSNAAKPVAPYNQAVVADRTVYVSGCLGLDKATMQLVSGGAVAQTEMALKNLEAVLKAADSDIDKVIKNTIFLKDLNDFGAVNEVYKKVFTKNFPARSCFQVARLPMDALVHWCAFHRTIVRAQITRILTLLVSVVTKPSTNAHA